MDSMMRLLIKEKENRVLCNENGCGRITEEMIQHVRDVFEAVIEERLKTWYADSIAKSNVVGVWKAGSEEKQESDSGEDDEK